MWYFDIPKIYKLFYLTLDFTETHGNGSITPVTLYSFYLYFAKATAVEIYGVIEKYIKSERRFVQI